MRTKRMRERALCLAMEPRLLMAATLLDTVTLPGVANNGWVYDTGPFNASTILTGQSGTDTNILLTVGGDGNLYGYDYNPNTGHVELYGGTQTPSAVPPIQATAAVVDIPGTGRAIFAATADGTVYAWDITTGQLLTGWPVNVTPPADLAFGAGSSNAVFGAITTADLDGDGKPEILVTSMNHELTVFHSDGTVAWRFNNDSAIVGGAVVGDLDGDGRMEVVIAGQSDADSHYAAGGRVTALSADGKRVWVRQFEQPIDSSPVLADLQGNGRLDVVVGTGLRNCASDGSGNRVYAIDAAGNDLPGWPYVTNGSAAVDAGVMSSPAIGDVNADGSLDVAVADGQGMVHLVTAAGQIIWKVQGFSAPVYSSPVLVDVNGDGILDVVVAAGSSVRAFSGIDGSVVFDYTDNTGAEIYRTTPAVGHLTSTDTVQLAFAGEELDTNSVMALAVLRVYDLGTPTVALAWAMLRQDAAGDALARKPGLANTLMTQVFEQSLQRAPDAGELASFGPAFNHAPDLNALVYQIVSSAEARTLIVQGWYTTFLNRTGEAAGVSQWLGYLASGHSYAQAMSFFVGSDEAFNLAGGTNAAWVNYMYQNLLGRLPSDAENAIWSGALAAGTAQRSDVVHGFLFSQEMSERQVDNWYGTYSPGNELTPDAVQLQAAGWDLRRGVTEEHVLSEILASNGQYDLAQRETSAIRTFYTDVLERSASSDEVVFWLTTLESGADLTAISQAVMNSLEYRILIVRGYYEQYLGRDAGSDELNFWANALGAGVTRQQMLAGFISSSEYMTRAGGTVAGLVNQAWNDVLGHGALGDNVSYWQGRADAGEDIRLALAQGLLNSQEYFTRVINAQYVTYLRHPATARVDGSAEIPDGAPFGEPYWLTYLSSGGTPEQMEATIVSSPEYANLAAAKAMWGGVRWM